LLSHAPKALNKFAQVLVSTSSKARDKSVPSAGQADTMPAEREKNTNQATISYLFQRRAGKVNMNKTQPEKTTPPLIPPIITTITQMQSPFPQRTPKESSRTKGEHIKKDKGKKAMSSEDTEEESTESDSNDKIIHVPGSTVDSSSKKELKKFNFVTEGGEHVYLTKEQISAQKEIEEEAKAEAAKCKGEIKKEELIDLLGLEVVNKYYNNKLQYDKYYDKMLNRRVASRITNCDVMTIKGPITLSKCTERMVQVKLFPISKPVICTLANGEKLHQGPGLDDHAKTFNSLLLAEIDKRNLNPFRQIRGIKQLSLSASVVEVPSASALQVLKRLGSISLQCMQRYRN
ncbi:hypothetical protein Tco_1324168, partial [Tanacetum coccineum]